MFLKKLFCLVACSLFFTAQAADYSKNEFYQKFQQEINEMAENNLIYSDQNKNNDLYIPDQEKLEVLTEKIVELADQKGYDIDELQASYLVGELVMSETIVLGFQRAFQKGMK